MVRMAGFLVVVAALAAPVLAVPGQRLIPDHGAYRDIADPFEKPDPSLRYKIVFEISDPARDLAKVHHGLERVGRMANLLSVHGVDVQPGDLVVAVHGAAGRALLTDAAHAKRFEGKPNPNIGILSALAKAGISVRICGQSMMAAGYGRDALHPDVKVDVSAITTVATYQMRGYALLQD
jgi:intracellular sulfur oxidation DsrE/DsrF family protein